MGLEHCTFVGCLFPIETGSSTASVSPQLLKDSQRAVIYPKFLCGTTLYKPGCEAEGKGNFLQHHDFLLAHRTHTEVKKTQMTLKLFCRAIYREILMIPFCPLQLHLNSKKQKCQYLER